MKSYKDYQPLAGFKSLQLLLYLLNQWSMFTRLSLDFKQNEIFVVFVRWRIQTQPLCNYLCNALPLEPPPSERIRMFRKVSVFRYSEPFPRSVSWFGLITESHFHINEKIVILIKFFFSSSFLNFQQNRGNAENQDLARGFNSAMFQGIPWWILFSFAYKLAPFSHNTFKSQEVSSSLQFSLCYLLTSK